MQGLVNQPGTGVIPFQAARTTTDVQLLSNVASGSYVYSNEAVQVRNAATPPVGIDQYTKLLLHCDGTNASTTFTDSEILAKTVTANGNAQISTAQSKFGGASGYFDGTGDYISIPDSGDWDFWNTSFTLDCWVRFSTVKYTTLLAQTADGTNYTALYIGSDTRMGGVAYSGGVLKGQLQSPVLSWTVGQWYHIAIVNNAGTFLFFRDGIQQATTINTAYSATMTGLSASLNIGGDSGASGNSMNGYIDEFRFSNGIARWIANFTPPTQSYALPGIDAYTKLALHMDGADSSTTFTDSCDVSKTVTRYGDAQIKTAQSVFGGASGYFDGTGDYIQIPDSDDWDLGVGDFTIDFRFRFASVTSYACMIGRSQSVDSSLQIGVNGTGTGLVFNIYEGGVEKISLVKTISASVNVWYHCAVVRYGNVFRWFFNGVQSGVDYSSSVSFANFSCPLTIGMFTGTSAYAFNGYIDELRISKGIARWTANFTPPDRAYENQDFSGQLIPAISTATVASQLRATSAGALNTYGATAKRYSGFVSKTEVGTI